MFRILGIVDVISGVPVGGGSLLAGVEMASSVVTVPCSNTPPVAMVVTGGGGVGVSGTGWVVKVMMVSCGQAEPLP